MDIYERIEEQKLHIYSDVDKLYGKRDQNRPPVLVGRCAGCGRHEARVPVCIGTDDRNSLVILIEWMCVPCIKRQRA